MTKEEILKRVKKFQGANREFSQELPPIIEGLIGLIDEAGPEVVDNLESNDPDKALSANMGKELNVSKMDAPSVTGEAGQILQLDENGDPEWVEAAAVGATYDSVVSDTSTNAIQNKTIKKYVDDNFAQKDGYYGSLTAGAAENLVGRGSVPAEIAFRTSGGDQDLGTGSALITKILGRTEAFNQQIQDKATFTTNGLQCAISGGVLTISGTATTTGTAEFCPISVINGHKYILISDSSIYGTGSISANTIHLASSTGNSLLRMAITQDQEYNMTVPLCFFDLTLMYGSGNEPSTAAQFRALHPLGYYSPASKLINNAATGLETTGFNQWDEVWEEGSISNSTGEDAPASATIRAKNYCPCIAGASYCLHCGSGGGIFLYWYDINKNFISNASAAANANTVVTAPSNAAYFRVRGYDPNYGTTYNNDICINLSWSGYRNGEYEPYEKHTLNLGLDNLACHDEDDNAVVVNGLDGVGTAQDELVVENGWGTKINKKRARVDLGSLTWSKSEAGYYNSNDLSATIYKPASLNEIPSGICSKYTMDTASNVLGKHGDKILSWGAAGTIVVYDAAFESSTVEQFKAAMAGVYLDYHLATPKHLTIDNPIPASYYVNDFGTEARLPQDTADDPQAPFCAEIQYAMNATDTIRRLPSQYISDESMTKILTALKTAGIIADFTLTYDSEHQYFTCSVTAPTTEGE